MSMGELLKRIIGRDPEPGPPWVHTFEWPIEEDPDDGEDDDS